MPGRLEYTEQGHAANDGQHDDTGHDGDGVLGLRSDMGLSLAYGPDASLR